MTQTPLPGVNQRVDRYPGHVQLADDGDIERAHNGNLPEFMNRQMTGVTVNDIQGSPFQVDLNYRGLRLSPLLGTPQGLSAYLDGVRINEPFGDVMNWDMLPEAAISTLALMPGSNPLYGLNTLGGALVMTTKSGLTHKGTEADFSIGSFGRSRLDLGHGVQWGQGWHAYVAGTRFSEQGWRENSAGRLGNIFLKLGRQYGGTDWSLSYTQARSNLNGNGLLNQSLYEIDRRAGYTFADTTRNRSELVNFNLTQTLSSKDQLSAVVWQRRSRRDASNGDISGVWTEWLEGCETAAGSPACSDPNAPGYVTQTATFNSSQASQSGAGASFQWSRKEERHHITVGSEYTASRVSYDQFSQEGAFDAGRVAQPDPAAPLVQDVALRGRTSTFSLFATDLIELGRGTHLTISGRWNRTRVSNDLGHPSPFTSEAFTYSKLNPAVGATHALNEKLGVFANLSQGTRVPTALELGCADPANPCVLPTGLQSDPYLKQVVARTMELGFRAKPAAGLKVSGAWFRTASQDDIVFVRSGISQGGYFTNVGQTRRQGLELSARWTQGALQWRADYMYLDATYQSEGELPGPLSTAARPNRFRAGTPVAGLPRHVLRWGVDWRASPSVRVGADWLLSGSQVVAGNEDGGRPELGKLASYSVLNARASWQVDPRWQAYVRVSNVLDRRYSSFAAGNLDLFPGGRAVQPGEAVNPARFVAPGAPRSLVVGVRYEWD
ncbi:TonB-dependent receptor [Polaromonas sp.]|uniref:TonB-dependent receptor n=1 Tax=Polaromonas sp. TaxID=1869339 RepID=UPI002CDB1D42|nr:TonB-dependent receptor [Polaromonas sp.]HQS31060.1 TonB-dependent receptor [Polaromonas sp.]HQS90199.1 TonB-dependent receptor [Polaromonas sp.]